MSTIKIIDGDGNPQNINAPLPAGQATKANSLPVTLASDSTLPLPTGAATDASVAAVGAKIPAVGQATKAASLPVTLASDSTLPLPTGAATASGQAAVVTALGTPMQQTGGTVGITGTVPLPTGAATDATVAGVVTAINSQALATGTKGAPASQTLSVQDNNCRKLLGSFSLTAAGTFFTLDLSDDTNPYDMLTICPSVSGTGGQLIVEATNDPSSGSQVWFGLRATLANQEGASGTVNSGTLNNYQIPYAYVRLRMTGTITGTYTCSALLTKGSANHRAVGGSIATNVTAYSQQPSNGANAQAVARNATLAGVATNKPYAIPQLDWQYVSATALADTTTVAMKASAGVGTRNYLTAIQINNAHASVATVVQVLDGSTLIWQANFAAGQSQSFHFPTPLHGTAATALNVKCVTTGSTVYVNAQGYTDASMA